MRALVTILASFILALGILGAGLTLLHTIPRKQKVTDPGLELALPADLDVRPEPIAARSKSGGPREASFRKEAKGDLRIEGRVQVEDGVSIGIKLLRLDDRVGLFLRRASLGTERKFHFEGLESGNYQVQVHESPSGRVLIEQVVRVPMKTDLLLDAEVARLARTLQFSPPGGKLEPGAVLVLENDRFFHQRKTGEEGGRFLTRGLPPGQIRYTLRGRLGRETPKLVWKGEFSISPASKADELRPMEIRLGAPQKDPID